MKQFKVIAQWSENCFQEVGEFDYFPQAVDFVKEKYVDAKGVKFRIYQMTFMRTLQM